jgi:hypothetical protein
VQLHWSEYLQGKWTNRISSDVEKSDLIAVHEDFDPRTVHIRVSKEMAQGNEGAIRIYLDFPAIYEDDYYSARWEAERQWAYDYYHRPDALPADKEAIDSIQWANHVFRVTSKNCNPDFRSTSESESPQKVVYSVTGVDATRYTGASKLAVSLSSTEQETILNGVGNFEILTCANTVVPPFLDPADSLPSGAGALVAPFFFKDTSKLDVNSTASFRPEQTFFVQPSLTETVIDQWAGWAIPPAAAKSFVAPVVLDSIRLIAQFSGNPVPADSVDPVYSLTQVRQVIDWATSPATAIVYGNWVIGKTGGIGPVQSDAAAAQSDIGHMKLNLATVARAAAPHLAVVGAEGLALRNIQSIQGSIRSAVAETAK